MAISILCFFFILLLSIQLSLSQFCKIAIVVTPYLLASFLYWFYTLVLILFFYCSQVHSCCYSKSKGNLLLTYLKNRDRTNLNDCILPTNEKITNRICIVDQNFSFISRIFGYILLNFFKTYVEYKSCCRTVMKRNLGTFAYNLQPTLKNQATYFFA